MRLNTSQQKTPQQKLAIPHVLIIHLGPHQLTQYTRYVLDLVDVIFRRHIFERLLPFPTWSGLSTLSLYRAVELPSLCPIRNVPMQRVSTLSLSAVPIISAMPKRCAMTLFEEIGFNRMGALLIRKRGCHSIFGDVWSFLMMLALVREELINHL